MKQTLLERVIQKLLLEQIRPIDYSDIIPDKSNKPIRSEFEPTGEDDPRKRIVIKDAPDAQITYAEGYGAVNAFRIIFNTTKEGKDLINDNNLIDLLKNSILKHPQLGTGSKYDNGNYMYVFSENQSIKQRQVYNVWILDYSKLRSIANSINDAEKSVKQFRKISSIPDVYTIAWFMADKIPILTYKSAVQWLSLMQNKAKQYSLVPRDISSNKPYKFPDLTKINRRPVEVTPIVDQRFEEVEAGNFIGTVKVTLDANGKEQREYYKGSIILNPTTSTGYKQIPEFNGEFKNGLPYKGVLTVKNSVTGDIISVWDGEVILRSDNTLVPAEGKGKYLKTRTLTYPVKITTENKTVSIVNVLPETGYVYGYVNDRFIQINQEDFENYYTLPDNDPNRKMYKIEDVTNEEIINKLKTKVKITVKKDSVGGISYPYTAKWFQINGISIVIYKLSTDNMNVYFYNPTDKAWYSMNRNDFETFDKVSPKKQENAPKQTKVTDTTKITELNKLSGNNPSESKIKETIVETKQEIWKSGDKLVPVKSIMDVYVRSGYSFKKHASISKSQISENINFKWCTGGKYAYVDINYVNQTNTKTYYILKTDVKKI